MSKTVEFGQKSQVILGIDSPPLLALGHSLVDPVMTWQKGLSCHDVVVNNLAK